MAWTSPATYSTGQLVTAADLNLIRDNLNALKAPPGEIVSLTSNLTTSSASFVDMTGATVTLTTTGGTLEITFVGTFDVSSGAGSSGDSVFLSVMVDGVALNANGVYQSADNLVNGAESIAFSIRHAAVAGSHTVKLQWKEGGAGNTIRLLGASRFCQFTVREAG